MHYGISAEDSCWFRSYLTNIYQDIITDNGKGNEMKSKMMTTVKGVPQRSILSHILFAVLSTNLTYILQYS